MTTITASPQERADSPAVIFDLDGVLADTEPIWSQSSVILLERRGKVYDMRLKHQFMGRSPREVVKRLAEHYGLADPPEALHRERLAIIEELYHQGPLRSLPGAQDLVRALAQVHIPCAVASGSPDPLIRLVLQAIELTPYLPVYVGSETVERGKPAPDVFLAAAERLGVRPQNCVVIEDAITGVQAALAAQMSCVAVAGPFITAEQLADAHLCVNSLTSLNPHLLVELVQSRHGQKERDVQNVKSITKQHS
jgi:HAD superfamily hydrolase (TIGR01509 family)